jgi:hypothetical protein
MSELAQTDKTTRFLSMAHLLTPAAVLAAFESLRKDASAGVDEVTYREYEQNVWVNIPSLHPRMVSHQYRAQPLRRIYIPQGKRKRAPHLARNFRATPTHQSRRPSISSASRTCVRAAGGGGSRFTSGRYANVFGGV